MAQTVIRNNEGEITHQLYSGRVFLPVADHKLVNETPVTSKMVEDTFHKNKAYAITRLLNEENDVKLMKFEMLVARGVLKDNSIIV